MKTVRHNLPRTLHKYVELRRKVLGLDGPLTFPNLYNPLLPSTEVPYTYDEGMKLVAEGLAPLGKAYVQQASIGMDPKNGWTDIYPNEDKRSGAYSNGSIAHDIHPFVLQNFDNTLDAVYTTAHEYGHAMHSFYSSSTQPPQYRGYTTFLAEIASTCNESLVTNFLLKKYKDDVDMTLMLLNQRLESMRLTIFRQTLFADFEAQFHAHAEAGNPLTAEWLNAKYKELITTYYGPGYEMAANDECEWMFIPHFYYDFYVFSYATGLTSGLALAEEISTKGQQVRRPLHRQHAEGRRQRPAAGHPAPRGRRPRDPRAHPERHGPLRPHGRPSSRRPGRRSRRRSRSRRRASLNLDLFLRDRRTTAPRRHPAAGGLLLWHCQSPDPRCLSLSSEPIISQLLA